MRVTTVFLVLIFSLVFTGAVFAQSDFEETKALAEKDDATAQYNLGILYTNGKGVPESDAKAMKWFRLAAEQGHVEAQYNLGILYAFGEGVTNSYAKAMKWFRLAADKGHADAQYNLGILYAKGKEHDTDAVKWFRLAAEQEHADAQYNLGSYYANGKRLPESDVEELALKCFESNHKNCYGSKPTLEKNYSHSIILNNVEVVDINGSGETKNEYLTDQLQQQLFDYFINKSNEFIIPVIERKAFITNEEEISLANDLAESLSTLETVNKFTKKLSPDSFQKLMPSEKIKVILNKIPSTYVLYVEAKVENKIGVKTRVAVDAALQLFVPFGLGGINTLTENTTKIRLVLIQCQTGNVVWGTELVFTTPLRLENERLFIGSSLDIYPLFQEL